MHLRATELAGILQRQLNIASGLGASPGDGGEPPFSGVDVNAGEWGLAAIPGRSAEARRDIELALEYACQLGCPQVHIMAGVVPPGADRAAREAVLRRAPILRR